MEYREDGTIVADYPKVDADGNHVGIEKVTLRRPILDELFSLWEALDRLAEHKPDAALPPLRRDLDTLRNNARWTRQAVAVLGTPAVYDLDGEPGVAVVKAGYAEPSWLASGQIAGRMLRHWQDVPLDPGGPQA